MLLLQFVLQLLNFQDGVNSKTEIFRVLEKKSFRHQEGFAQPEQVMKGSQTTLKIPYGGDGNSSQPSKFTAGSKAKGSDNPKNNKVDSETCKVKSPKASGPEMQHDSEKVNKNKNQGLK